MVEQKRRARSNIERGKRTSEETVFQRIDANRNGKDKTAWSLSSQRERRRGRRIQVSRNRRDTRYESLKRIQRVSSSKRRRVIDEETVMIINDDVLEEIILRLPVASLLRFQTVSKHWRGTVNSVSFRERYLLHQRTRQDPGFMCVYTEKENPSCLILHSMRLEWSWTHPVRQASAYRIEPQGYQGLKVTGCCDGLVCISDAINIMSPVTITNPAMGRSQTLPLSIFQRQYLDNKITPDPDIISFPGLGKDCVTGTYKLVWVHNKLIPDASSCEVFDFEAKEWRYVADTPYTVTNYEAPRHAKGWLYWLTCKGKILAFNLHTDMFRVIEDDLFSCAICPETIRLWSPSDDRLWVTVIVRGTIQYFWRLKDEFDSDGEFDEMLSIGTSLASTWFLPSDCDLPNLQLMATKDTKKVLVSKLGLMFNFQPLPTLVYTGPRHSWFIPYFQSLEFPLL